MGKGTASQGMKSSKKLHIACRRCGKMTYHMRDKVCSSCGYGKSPRMRSYSWKKQK